MAKILMKGNEAVAEAAVRGGCRFFAGYPITPQSEIPEYLSSRLPEGILSILIVSVLPLGFMRRSIWKGGTV